MVYINTRRDHDYEGQVLSYTRAKIQYYEEMRIPFEQYAKASGMEPETMAAGLTTLENLIEYWRDKEEGGE